MTVSTGQILLVTCNQCLSQIGRKYLDNKKFGYRVTRKVKHAEWAVAACERLIEFDEREQVRGDSYNSEREKWLAELWRQGVDKTNRERAEVEWNRCLKRYFATGKNYAGKPPESFENLLAEAKEEVETVHAEQARRPAEGRKKQRATLARKRAAKTGAAVVSSSSSDKKESSSEMSSVVESSTTTHATREKDIWPRKSSGQQSRRKRKL